MSCRTERSFALLSTVYANRGKTLDQDRLMPVHLVERLDRSTVLLSALPCVSGVGCPAQIASASEV